MRGVARRCGREGGGSDLKCCTNGSINCPCINYVQKLKRHENTTKSRVQKLLSQSWGILSICTRTELPTPSPPPISSHGTECTRHSSAQTYKLCAYGELWVRVRVRVCVLVCVCECGCVCACVSWLYLPQSPLTAKTSYPNTKANIYI